MSDSESQQEKPVAVEKKIIGRLISVVRLHNIENTENYPLVLIACPNMADTRGFVR